MESLLPSEIARLVLGYLEEQKCEEAARSFLQLSPHLQECRTVNSTGRRFSTKVNGFTLVEILEKFCAANTMIQERLSKVADCEQLKHCGDLQEQLRFLVDGSRGQRFVVNINVPTTSQASCGSPIISSSMRKRHHSGSERERSKRAQKSLSQCLAKSSEPVTTRPSCMAVETTPLETLPGHSSCEKLEMAGIKSLEKSQELTVVTNCSSTVPEATGPEMALENPATHPRTVHLDSFPKSIVSNLENDEKNRGQCSTGTDTDQLMQYTNTEVQTTPDDVVESETESAYEPVENLSLLTKELLNRTELQERIAENINKAILPSDTSLRDISLTESVGGGCAGEMNTSIMTELNNAIKSVVTATESDPVFAQFLDEIIGPSSRNDESPDEENDHQPLDVDELSRNTAGTISKEPETESSALFDKLVAPKSPTTEVPLKNRLRSSTGQLPVRADEDRAITDNLVPKDDATALEDVNAAAILSIINANTLAGEEKTEVASEITKNEVEIASVPAEPRSEIPEIVASDPEKLVEEEKPVSEIENIVEPAKPMEIAETVETAKSVDIEKTALPTTKSIVEGKSRRKSNSVRKPKIPKAKEKVAPIIPPNIISEEDIMAMPTLIVCSKEEISSIMNTATMMDEPVSSGGYCASQFLPIAPKTAEVLSRPPKPEPIYLRTVTVPTKISEIPKLSGDDMHNLQPVQGPPWPEINRVAQQATAAIEVSEQAPVDNTDILAIVPAEGKNPEKITLYGDETRAITVLENPIIPSLQVDAAIPSVSGTGLSPFLKFNDNPKDPAPSLPMLNVQDDSQIASTSNIDNYDHITKRTPRSLLKSRSKNNRLSMSTPRRRSSHIRALDFNTPLKSIKAGRRMSTNESFEYSSKNTSFEKKVCRTSLFKSPPFTAATPSPRKIKSPAKDSGSCKIPIATRSPAPKLRGGWEKYTGVGMILGSSSPSSSGGSPVKTPTTLEPTVKSWDEDLRKSLATTDESTTLKTAKKIFTKKSTTSNRRTSRRKNLASTPAAIIGEASSDSEPFPGPSETQNSTGLPVSSSTGNSSQTAHQSLKEKSAILKKTVHDQVAPNPPNNPEPSKKIDANNCAGNRSGDLANDDTSGTVAKKKYAKLKTITTTVTKIERSNDIIGVSSLSVEKIGEFSCTEKNARMQLPDMLSLETPRKLEASFGIPPTPRLLSPSSNLTTPFAQIVDDTTKVQGFVSTPEFPPTPSINLTPKQTSEDGTQREQQFQTGSEYYEPSNKPKDPRPKRNNDHSRHDMSLPLPGMMMAIAAESRVKNISVQVAQGFQATTTTNKLEITQFEVIKENLPREEAFRELKISQGPNEISNNDHLSMSVQEVHEVSSEDDPHDTKDPNNTSSTLDDSSDSDTSSSSDTSSTSSSSSSSSSTTTNPSPNFTLNKPSPKTPACKIYTDTSNDSAHKSRQMCDNVVSSVQQPTTEHSIDHTSLIDNSSIAEVHASREENENSPTKVFPILKNDQQLEESNTETPAKDESLLSEAVISETPSSSKAGIETTNLHSKISAFITSEKQASNSQDSLVETKKNLPKIVSIQRILPNVSIAMKPPPISDNLYNAMQSRNQSKSISDAKLSKHLEDKRLRVMAMFKEKEKPPLHRPRIKRAVVIARAKKRVSESEKIAGTSVTGEGKIDVQANEKEEIVPEVQEIHSTEEAIEKGIEIEKKILPLNEDVESTSKINVDEKSEKISSSKVMDDEKSTSSERKIVVEEEQVTTTKILNEEKEKTMKNYNDKKFQKKQKQPTLYDILEESCESLRSKDAIPGDKNDEVSGNKGGNAPKIDDLKSDKVTEQKVAKSQRSRSVERTKTKNEPEAGKTQQEAQEMFTQDCVNRQNFVNPDIAHEEKVEKSENYSENPKEEEKDKKETICVSIDAKAITKSKVDLVKRDLFSDEESNDQRTTRSKSRQNSDCRRSNSLEPHVSSLSSLSEKNNAPSCASDEDMPDVLECLDLVPTVKGDTNDESLADLDNSSLRVHADLNFIYDESVPTKKRRRKFSSSELEFTIQVELTDGTPRQCSKLMTATNLEEIFNISPPRKRRGAGKELKQAQVKKKDNLPVKKAKSSFKVIQDKPLATSSPVFKATTSKVAVKTLKSPKKIEPPPNEAKKKPNPIKDAKPQEHEKRNPKPRKRKASLSKESDLQLEKKMCRTNPKLLLDKLDLDKFLTTVHGPA